MLRAVVFFAFIALVKGQNIDNNTCALPKLNETVNVAEFDGLWHELYRAPNEFETGNCSTVTFNQNAGTIVIREVIHGEENLINGNYSTTTNGDYFHININDTTFEMHVFATNLEGYALIIMCDYNAVTLAPEVSGWVLSRNQTLSVSDATSIASIIASNPELVQLSLEPSIHSEESCKVNGGSSLRLSAVLLAVMFGSFKLFLA